MSTDGSDISLSTNDDFVSSQHTWSTTDSVHDNLYLEFARIVHKLLQYHGDAVYLSGYELLTAFDDKMEIFLFQREWSYSHYLGYKRAEKYYLESIMLWLRNERRYRLPRRDLKRWLKSFPNYIDLLKEPLFPRDYYMFPHTDWNDIDKLVRWGNYTEKMFEEDSTNDWYMTYRSGSEYFVPQPEVDDRVFSEQEMIEWNVEQVFHPDPNDPTIEVPIGLDVINSRCADGLPIDDDDNDEMDSSNWWLDYDEDNTSISNVYPQEGW
jgi:hypothetical protein